MKIFAFLSVMAIMCLCSSNICIYGQSMNEPRLSGLDTLLEHLLQEWHAPGVGIAVVEKDKVIFSGGFGFRDFENKKPVTKRTQFAIGSSTKAFTSAVLGKLQEEGKLDFDEKVTTYLPGFKFYKDDMNRLITIRDLTCHRTGLPRHDFSWYLNPTTRDSMIQRIQYLEPSHPVRARWQYNNFMFLLQGHIAEQLTGKSWEENIREMFFAPLEMEMSNFSGWNQSNGEVALGYYKDKEDRIKRLDYYKISEMGPAGSIYSTPEEMARWIMMWVNGGKWNEKEILPSGYIREAISSQMVVGAGMPSTDVPDASFSNYGMGWMLSNYRGHYRVEHGGNIDGFSASVAFYPADSIGIVVLVNQDGSRLPGMIRNYISDMILDLPHRDWHDLSYQAIEKAKKAESEGKAEKTDNRKTGTVPTHALSAFEGAYNHPGYGTYKFFIRNDSLFAQTGSLLIWAEHYHHNIFLPQIQKEGLNLGEDNPFRLQFEMNLAGDIEIMTLAGVEQGIEPIKFRREIKEIALEADELTKYTGAYELAGTVVKVFLRGGVLTIQVPGQPDYSTISVGNHKFNLKDLDGFSIQFDVGDNDLVEAVNFIQPNGTFRAVRKPE